jgi:toxin ParE1/3/4
VRIDLHPEIGVRRVDLAPDPYRVLFRAGFNYLMIYNAEYRPPLIARSIHGARDLRNVLRDFP